MKIHLFIGLMSFMTLFFSGCVSNPVHTSRFPMSSIGGTKVATVYSLTPERRNIIMIPHASVDTPEKNRIRICAEPSPDTAENIAFSLSALLQAEVKNVDITAAVATALAKSSQSLFTRSQGVQLFRDGMYNLCQAYINQAITAAQYDANYKELLTVAAKIIEKELPDLYKMKIELTKQTLPLPGPGPTPQTGQFSGKFSGTITSVNANEKSIVVTGDKNVTNTFVIDTKTKITKDTMELQLEKLEQNMKVDVEYKKEGKKMIATAIKVSS